jgi:hypothetical protein
MGTSSVAPSSAPITPPVRPGSALLDLFSMFSMLGAVFSMLGEALTAVTEFVFALFAGIFSGRGGMGRGMGSRKSRRGRLLRLSAYIDATEAEAPDDLIDDGGALFLHQQDYRYKSTAMMSESVREAE